MKAVPFYLNISLLPPGHRLLSFIWAHLRHSRPPQLCDILKLAATRSRKGRTGVSDRSHHSLPFLPLLQAHPYHTSLQHAIISVPSSVDCVVSVPGCPEQLFVLYASSFLLCAMATLADGMDSVAQLCLPPCWCSG